MAMSDRNPGIYVHLPFCAVHCSYCDFPISTRNALAPSYYDVLLKEIDMHPVDPIADTLYFGGGTPSLTPARTLEQICSRFELAQNCELTLEANPDDVSETTVRNWLEIGVNRISIGIQSLEDPVLGFSLRKHTAAEGVEAIRIAQNAGCSNLNVDLILGSPHQTRNGFLEGLNRVLRFRPQHFSLYLLEVHDPTLLARRIREGKAELMPEETQLECFRSARDLLCAAGYVHYEVSNFALPGKESRHNLKYWSDTPYFAYGAGASSYIPPFRVQNLSSVPAYIQALKENRLPYQSKEQETTDTRVRNALIFGLRKTEGVDINAFEETFHVSPVSLFDNGIDQYVEAGWMEMRDNRLRLTLSGMLVSNEILASVI